MMWRQCYLALTTYQGMYLCYLAPIVYFFILIGKLLSHGVKRHAFIGVKDFSAGAAIGLIALDFARYLYLFWTHTGRILPFPFLIVKYAVGGLLWGWVFWYCYEHYLNRRAAGAAFTKRWTILLGCCAAGLLLAVIGSAMSA